MKGRQAVTEIYNASDERVVENFWRPPPMFLLSKLSLEKGRDQLGIHDGNGHLGPFSISNGRAYPRP
jgi:hypothetical protein